jgi:hypothetical protein
MSDPKIYKYGDLKYVRLSEIPEPLRSRFLEYQFGSQQPIILGVPDTDAFYAWDFDTFIGSRDKKRE